VHGRAEKWIYPSLHGEWTEESYVFEVQVRALYEKGFVALIINVINAAVLVVVLFSMVSHRNALLWCIAMNVVVGIRLHAWHRHGSALREGYDARRWARLWIAGTAVTGLGWGSAAILLLPAQSVAGQNFVLFLIGGMVAGASASMSSYQPAFAAFAVPALVPPIVCLLRYFDRVHVAMALLLAIFGGAMTAIARSGGKALIEST
jgi:hypothetical protein